MSNEPKHGWHPLVMACPDCDWTSFGCPTCDGTGWMPGSHAINEGLFMAGLCVAKVEAFCDGGPWYANAITPDGDYVRGGPSRSHSAAAEWCERTSGFAVGRDARGDAEGGGT